MQMNVDKAIQILDIQVTKGMTVTDLKRVYRKLVIKHHPDKFKSAENKARATENFKKIQSAYEYILPIFEDIAKQDQPQQKQRHEKKHEHKQQQNTHKQQKQKQQRKEQPKKRYPTATETSKNSLSVKREHRSFEEMFTDHFQGLHL